MVKYLGKLAQDIKDYFGYPKDVHLGLGRKVSPVYLVNPVGTLKVYNLSVTAVQNQWYDVIGGVACSDGQGKKLSNVRVLYMGFNMNTLAEDIAETVIVDGEEFDGTQAAAGAGSNYSCYILKSDGNNSVNEDAASVRNAAMFSSFAAREFSFQIRKTTANGANILKGWVVVEEF